MDTRISMAAVFVAGLSIGWLGKTWLEPVESNLPTDTSADSQTIVALNDVALNDIVPVQPRDIDNIALNDLNNSIASQSNSQDVSQVQTTTAQTTVAQTTTADTNTVNEASADNDTIDAFSKLLNEKLYADAMVLYQELIQQSNNSARLRMRLLDEFNLLLQTRSNSAFSALVESYLSIYYDDIDVLLLLADFNKANASYLEVIDVYLLARTYAYTDSDARTVDMRLNNFVEQMDGLYTRQENWWALINLFSHLDTSGLMNSNFEYRRAIAHLRSGDEQFAVEKLNQLLGDNIVGESAAIALSNLADGSVVPLVIADNLDEPPSDAEDVIPLEKRGNQYLVNLSNRQSRVRLLIDTGASMTVISVATFSSFNADGSAIEQERRVFQTAGGVVMGTVYTVPELRLGPYLLKNTQVAVIDFDSDREIDGLLGMNILGQFKFQIDQENSRLLLSKG